MSHENVEDEQSLGFSQFGEDLMILNAFGERSGFYVEVGANHPTILNQTYRLEKAGWSGLAIDPLPNFVDEWRQLRPRTEFFNCAVGSNEVPGKCYLVTPNGDHLLSFVAAEKPASMSCVEVDILSLNHI